MVCPSKSEQLRKKDAMKKGEIPTQTEIPAGTSISNPSRPFVRLRGSHSSKEEIVATARARRRRDDDDDPLPDDDPPPPPPPPPPPAVSTPDLALQLLICLDQDLNNSIVSTVREAISPNADVRTACINGTQRIGIWLRPFVNAEDNRARDRGMAQLNLLGPGETLTFFINASLIRRQAFDGWNAAPKRLNGDGRPNPDGPVHLTSFSLIFESPDKVITKIGGFDERPWPDVSFTLTITDTLSAVNSDLHCDSVRDLDVDTSWINFLTGVFLLLLPPLGIVFLVERLIIASRDAPDVDAGAGCGALGLIPKEILIPGGQKVVAFYNRADVSNAGIFAGGSVEIMPRSPEVTISGPTRLAAEEEQSSVTATYRLHTDDLRPPFHEVLSTATATFGARVPGPGTTPPRPRIVWSGDGTPLRPSAEVTGFRFNTTGAHAGDILTRRVAVLVVDADGLSASAELIVRIHITPIGGDDDFPPVCKNKPWLPQCQEPMARVSSSRQRSEQ